MWLLLALLACSGAEQDEPTAPNEADQSETTAAQPFGDLQTTNQLMSGPSATIITASSGEGAAVVELRFFEVGALHRGYFSDTSAVGALSEALGPCISQTAQVLVAYDQEQRIGRILLKAPPGSLACAPAQDGDAIDLSALVPVGRALAAYRDDIAARFDYRVSSFKIGVSFTRGARSCDLFFGGTHPPDGTAFDPCLHCATGAMCAQGGEEGVTRLRFADRSSSRYVRECLRP